MINWHLNNIPKRAYFYWGGGNLPYIGYLSIVSFKKQNPDWDVNFYYPIKSNHQCSWSSTEHKYQRKFDDYFCDVFKLDINITEVDFFKWFGISNDISEVHKSDFIRWGLLPDGGLWSDMDIFYFKPMTSLKINIPENKDKTTGVTLSSYGHSVGFLLSSIDNKYFIKMAKLSSINFSPLQYQCLGCNMMANVIPVDGSDSEIVDIGMDAVYYYNAQNVSRIYASSKSPELIDGAIGCHWYAGHKLSGEFLNRTNGGLIQENTMISKLIWSV